MSRGYSTSHPLPSCRVFDDVVGEGQKPLVVALFRSGKLTPLLRGAVEQRGHAGVGGRIAHVTIGASVMIVAWSWRH
jgi:hypothetical protein